MLAGRELFDEVGLLPGEAALSQACLAFAATFQDRARADEQIRRAEDMLTVTTVRWAELQLRNAELLREAGADWTAPGFTDSPHDARMKAAMVAWSVHAWYSVRSMV